VSAAPQLLAVVISATLNPARAAVFTSPAFKAAAAKPKPKLAQKKQSKRKKRR
jgi:hypothetical protein